MRTERVGSSTYITLDWDKVYGALPFKIPFCSAVVADDGTIYVSGTMYICWDSNPGRPSAD